MNTIKLLKANYRKSSLDAIAYADHLEELGRLGESERIRMLVDFSQKVRTICIKFEKDCIRRDHCYHKISLITGAYLEIHGVALTVKPGLTNLRFYICAISRTDKSYRIGLGRFSKALGVKNSFSLFMRECERLLRTVRHDDDRIAPSFFPSSAAIAAAAAEAARRL